MKNFEKANQRNSRAALIQQILDEIHLTPFTYLKEYLKTTRCQKLANNGYTNLEGKSSICFEFRSNRLTKIVKFLDRKIAKKEDFFDFFIHTMPKLQATFPMLILHKFQGNHQGSIKV